MDDDVFRDFDAVLSKLNSMNLDAGLKSNLGDVAIPAVIRDRITQVVERCNSARDYVPRISKLQVYPFIESIKSLIQIINAMIDTDPASFIQQRQSYINTISDRIDQIEASILPFDLAKYGSRVEKLLGGDDRDLDQARRAISAEADEILKRVRAEAESVLLEAKSKASEIQATARSTASGVSLLQTSVRFSDLINNLRLGLIGSGSAAALAFITFVLYVVWLAYHQPDLRTLPEAVYTSAVRVTLLASMAAVVSFALKIFRSNLHMYYHTLHRQQLTNSIESFIDAARTDEQRDVVLAKLIDTVSTFGTSGLVGSSEDMPNTAKIIVDSLPKAISRADH
ncbi:hypothetical protein ACQR1Y_18805 [Bradyrhizobium sp. HKCCYLRH3099]|uniref:hypothetical protein n=1 Tax=unclassified Bradyrhizobium TaxID=2631580 RepID=UPI003EBE80A7